MAVRIDDLLAGAADGPATVVVIAPPAGKLGERLDLAGADSSRTLVLHPRDARTVDDLHDRLRLLPQIDLIVDARPKAQWRRWLHLFFHLRPDGAWVALRPLTSSWRLADELDALRRRERGLGRRLAEPRLAMADVVRDDERLVVRKQGEHLLKLRDADVPVVMADRCPQLTVTELSQLPGGRLEIDGLVTSHGLDADELRAPMDYPALHLRRYEGPLTLIEGCVARHATTLLPDTYRWHLQDVPVNKRLVDIGEHWARLRRDEPVSSHVPGSFYYLDYKNPGHWGHLTTEAVSRLWGWPAAKAADPALKLLLRRGPRHAADVARRPETALLQAFGIAPDDVVWADESVTVDSLVGVTPMWHNKAPYSAHPAIRDVWARIREGLPDADVPGHDRVFVTRRSGNRRCRNVEEVEAFFAARGFAIVDPGDLSIPEQAATFARATVVAGLAGAGMFNLIFAERLRRVVVLSQSAYDARNELLMAAVHGAETHYFWSRPDIDHPDGGWDYRAHQSPWAFDLSGHAATIDAVLHAG